MMAAPTESKNFSSLTTVTTPADGDELYLQDASEAVATDKPKRITMSDFQSYLETDLVGVVFSQTADVTVASTVTETTLVGAGTGTVTLPADLLEVGKAIRVRARGINSTTSPAGTMTFRVKFGTTTLVASPANTATNSLSNRGWDLDAEIVCRTVGATGTVRAQGKIYRSTGAGTSETWMMASTSDITIDTTAAQSLTVTVEWGTSDASNTITCTNLSVEILN